jgi:hypothetical protein
MPEISTIPKRYIEGFKRIASCDPKAFAAVVEGISYTSLVSSISKLADNVAKVNKNLDAADLHKMFVSIGSLVPFLDTETTIEKIVKDLSKIAIDEDIIDKEHVDDFTKKVHSLLSAQQIYYAAKASDIATEYSNVYLQAKIVTDVRPVFGVDITEFPKAAMTLHNLHLHYISDIEGDHKDIFIALDSKDIKALKELLIRAENKEKTLLEIYSKAKIINLNE